MGEAGMRMNGERPQDYLARRAFQKERVRETKKRGYMHRRRIQRRNSSRPRAPRPGVCRYCQCTDQRACILGVDFIEDTPITCYWIDRSRTVCSNPECVKKHREARG